MSLYMQALRGISVILVIFFHMGFDTFRNGWIGVDIFFVISGYLITTIIATELEKGKFSIVGFYERRARRILPPLFVVMIFCIPFVEDWFFLNQQKDFYKSLVAVSVFSSNIFFLAR